MVVVSPLLPLLFLLSVLCFRHWCRCCQCGFSVSNASRPLMKMTKGSRWVVVKDVFSPFLLSVQGFGDDFQRRMLTPPSCCSRGWEIPRTEVVQKSLLDVASSRARCCLELSIASCLLILLLLLLNNCPLRRIVLEDVDALC